MSVISSVITKYESMSFPGGSASKPPIYFDLAPTRDSDGSLLLLPWVVLKDGGMRIEYDFEYHPMEVTTFDFEIYHVQLLNADAVAEAIKYGTSAATQAGFDFGTLDLSPKTFMKCERTGERRDLQPIQTETVQLVHRVVLTYDVQAEYTF